MLSEMSLPWKAECDPRDGDEDAEHASDISAASEPRWPLCQGIISKTSLNDPPVDNFCHIASQQKED